FNLVKRDIVQLQAVEAAFRQGSRQLREEQTVHCRAGRGAFARWIFGTVFLAIGENENKAKHKQERRGNKKKLITFFRVLFRVGRWRKGLIIHRSPRSSLSEYSCELVANYVPGLFTCTPSPTRG